MIVHFFIFIFYAGCDGILDEKWLIISSYKLFAVYNVWIRLYPAIFRVGKSGGDAWHKEHMFEGSRPFAGGDTYMVLGHHIPFLRSH